MTPRTRRALPGTAPCLRGRAAALAIITCAALPLAAAELEPRTAAAFTRYVHLTESRMERDGAFVVIDAWPADRQRAAAAELRRGGYLIERLDTRDAAHRAVGVPGGLLHHWVGLAFVPGATVDQGLALLQDYDAHQQIYAPAIARSALLSRDGGEFRVFLRFSFRKIVAVVVNSEHVARFTRPAPDRAEGRIYSTRIAEVDNPGTAHERERPVGQDNGYLWRLNTYWRLLARDGGLYVQCETVSLTRAIPAGLGWIVGPFVTSIPRESLGFTLETTRRALGAPGSGLGTRDSGFGARDGGAVK